MTDKPDHLPSRELIKQTGIRAKDVTPLLELVVSSKSLSPQLISWIGFSGKPDALSRDRGKVRWYLRRDLSRCKWIFDDLMNEAKGSVYPSTVKEQRKQIAESAQDLLKNMEKVSDWSFLRRLATTYIEELNEENDRLLAELNDLARRKSNIITAVHRQLAKAEPEQRQAIAQKGDSELDRTACNREKLRIRTERIDAIKAAFCSEDGEPRPEMLVEGIASKLIILKRLVSSPSKTEAQQKYWAGQAKRRLANDLRELAGIYVNNRAYTFKNGEAGIALGFAHEASTFVIRSGISPQVLRKFWKQRGPVG